MYIEGTNGERMHKFFYHSVVSLIYKKDQSELDNYRQISLMNMDYKILAKIIMNSMNEWILEQNNRKRTNVQSKEGLCGTV